MLNFSHDSIKISCKAVIIPSSLSNFSSIVYLFSAFLRLRIDLLVDDSGMKDFSGDDNDENIGKTLWDHDQNIKEENWGSDGDNSPKREIKFTTVLAHFADSREIIFVFS